MGILGWAKLWNSGCPFAFSQWVSSLPAPGGEVSTVFSTSWRTSWRWHTLPNQQVKAASPFLILGDRNRDSGCWKLKGMADWPCSSPAAVQLVGQEAWLLSDLQCSSLWAQLREAREVAGQIRLHGHVYSDADRCPGEETSKAECTAYRCTWAGATQILWRNGWQYKGGWWLRATLTCRLFLTSQSPWFTLGPALGLSILWVWADI